MTDLLSMIRPYTIDGNELFHGRVEDLLHPTAVSDELLRNDRPDTLNKAQANEVYEIWSHMGGVKIKASSL